MLPQFPAGIWFTLPLFTDKGCRVINIWGSSVQGLQPAQHVLWQAAVDVAAVDVEAGARRQVPITEGYLVCQPDG